MNILLLTATIAPLNGIPMLKRCDPASRANDYLKSLLFYTDLLGRCFDGIVFAENSGTDLQMLRSHVAGRQGDDQVEFLSFSGLDYPPSYGRGYGEFKLVDHAMATSSLIDLAADCVVWKCTGRYIIRNMERIVHSRPAQADLYCNKRNHPYRWCDLYLLSWTRAGYEAAVKGVYPRLRNDVVPFQHISEEITFRRWLDEEVSGIEVVPRFREVPLIQAIRGGDNKSYRDRPWDPKILTRRVAATFLPQLWI